MVVFDILLRASWRGGGANWVKCRRRRRRRQNGRFASGGAAEWESGMSSVGTRRRNVDHGGIASSSIDIPLDAPRRGGDVVHTEREYPYL